MYTVCWTEPPEIDGLPDSYVPLVDKWSRIENRQDLLELLKKIQEEDLCPIEDVLVFPHDSEMDMYELIKEIE